MHCFEHELLCRTLDELIRGLDRSVHLDRLDISDALAAAGLDSMSALDARGPGALEALARDLAGDTVSLAA